MSGIEETATRLPGTHTRGASPNRPCPSGARDPVGSRGRKIEEVRSMSFSPMSFSPEVASLRLPLSSSSPRCAVCHGRDVSLDEVFDGGALQLCECRHCEHRWTFRPRSIQADRSLMPRTVKRSSGSGRARRTGFVSAA